MVRTWPAVLVAPILVLVDQSVAYVLVPWSCSHQTTVWLHVTHLVFLAATLATVFPAMRRLHPEAPPTSPDEQGERRRLFGFLGLWIAALSALVVAAMWAMQWFIPACIS
jgi:hypothetical protein